MGRLWLVCAALALPAAAFGADGATESVSFLSALIPLLTPILVRLLAQLATILARELPSHYLPILAPVLGAVAELTLHYSDAGVPGLSPSTAALVGAVLGSAGVGIREAADQLRRRVSDR